MKKGSLCPHEDYVIETSNQDQLRYWYYKEWLMHNTSNLGGLKTWRIWENHSAEVTKEGWPAWPEGISLWKIYINCFPERGKSFCQNEWPCSILGTEKIKFFKRESVWRDEFREVAGGQIKTDLWWKCNFYSIYGRKLLE